jgi:hypothetical protein
MYIWLEHVKVTAKFKAMLDVTKCELQDGVYMDEAFMCKEKYGKGA